MKTYAAALVVALLALSVVGCKTPTKQISFDSEPRGARVFLAAGINEDSAKGARNFLGTTPFIWTAELDSNQTLKMPGGVPVYSSFVKRVAVFTAEPPASATNLFTKREVYHSNAQFQQGDKAPDGIFFDLTKP